MTVYKNLIIYYLSGTGNAMNAAKWIAEDFENAGIESQVYSIDRYKTISKPEFDKTLLGFCFPTHGFSVAPYMLNFIFKFPRSSNKTHIFLLNTRAGMKMNNFFLPGLSGLAQFLPALILLLKGYKVRYMQPLDLPSNWISIHPGLRPKIIESIYSRCRSIVGRMSDRLLNKKRRYQAFWSLPIDLAIIPISIIYYFVGRYGLAKTFYSTSDCNQCGICIDNCPIQAIAYKGKQPFWSYQCESCMRCMNVCPQRAIQTSHGYSILLWWLISSIFYPFIHKKINSFTDILLQDNIISISLNYLIQISVFLIFILLSYFAAHYIMRLKVFERIFRFTSMTYYKFWRRYKAPGLKVSHFKKDRIN